MQTEETAKSDDTPKVDVVPKVDESLSTVIERINDADSILVTLSKDPTVDEMVAALGLTLMLDKYGKHVTAIYSGKTPNALEFLKPNETFEANTNSLQDFIIALDKEKADHLRYKIEGDFVKVYITPYKTTISESDLEFSRGEVNVDLIIAIDVIEAEDLDAALAQHGRIMHNASLVNISNGTPGRLGGVEWNDAQASSVSEMIVVLLEQMGQTIPKDVATALLTGIVSATERFSNERTTPETMALSSRLMQLGADQQLIVAQIMSAKEPVKAEASSEANVQTVVPEIEKKDDGILDVEHSEEPSAVEQMSNMQTPAEEQLSPEEQLERMISGDTGVQGTSAGTVMKELENVVPEVPEMTEAPVATLAPEVPVVEVTEAPVTEAPIGIESPLSEFATPGLYVEPENNNMVASVPQSKIDAETTYGVDSDRTQMEEKTMKPLDDGGIKDYGAMIDNELGAGAQNPAMMAAPVAPTVPEVAPIAPEMTAQAMTVAPEAQAATQPAMMEATTPSLPEVQPMMGGVELPLPPAPDINGAMPPAAPEMSTMPEMPAVDDSAAELTVAAPTGVQVQPEPINPVVVQPDQNPASVPPVQDPGAFKIPGM